MHEYINDILFREISDMFSCTSGKGKSKGYNETSSSLSYFEFHDDFDIAICTLRRLTDKIVKDATVQDIESFCKCKVHDTRLQNMIMIASIVMNVNKMTKRNL